MRNNRNYKRCDISTEPIVVHAVVTSEPYKIKFKNKDGSEKTKTVFDIKTLIGNDTTCFYWNNSTVQKDDEVRITGRLVTKGFVVWNMQITKRAE